MEDWQREAFVTVAEAVAGGGSDDVTPLGGLPVVVVEGGCPVVVTESGTTARTGPRCGRVIGRGVLKGQRCRRVAGQGTVHVGAGLCVAHGGAKRLGRAEGAWLVAHAFARELDCDPWEGLLRAVRVAAGKLAYCEWVLAQAQSDLELEGRVVRTDTGAGGVSGDRGGLNALLVHPDTGEPLGVGEFRDRSWWVQKSELWTDRLARYSKMSIDAGVAERLVHAVEVEAQTMGRVLTAALEQLEGQVSEEVLGQVRARMRSELLAIDHEQSVTRVRASVDADVGHIDSTYRDA